MTGAIITGALIGAMLGQGFATLIKQEPKEIQTFGEPSAVIESWENTQEGTK